MKPIAAAGVAGFILLVTAGSLQALPYIYVSNLGDGTVSVIDTSSLSTIATPSVGGEPWGIALQRGGPTAYVADFVGARVVGIDTTTNLVASAIPVGEHPIGVAAHPDGSRIYVANFGGCSRLALG